MLRSLSKSVLALLMVAGLATISMAQDNDDITRPITKSGSMAFVFNLGGIGTFGLAPQAIGSVNMGSTGSTVTGAGVKWYISDNQAIKILLGLSMTDDGNDPANTTNVSGSMFGIGAQYEYHFGPLYSTSPYVGGGISFASGSTTSENSAGKTSQSGTNINIAAVGGFDWFFTKGLALGAQYSLGYSMNSMSSDPAPATDYPTSSTIGIAGGGSVHFLAYF